TAHAQRAYSRGVEQVSYYGAPPQGPPFGGPPAESPRLMNLMVPWAVGLVVNLVLQFTVAVVSWDLITGEDPTGMTTASSVLLLQLPSALCFAAATWAAAAVHRAPSRDSLPRHCAAALVPAVLLQTVVFLSQGSDLTALTVLVQLAVLATGCALGMLAERLRQGG
ncbi:hypothetical protein ACFQLX_03470, partial [Streptomyces polyrhachis]